MINGYIKLSDDTMITVTDENLAANSLSVTMSTCGSEFMIGTFNAAIMKLSIIDDQALEHDFDNAKIALQLVRGEDTLKLGEYWVDDAKTKRKKNVVSLTAQDASAVFDKELSSEIRNTTDEVGNMIGRVCYTLGIAFDSASFSPSINRGTFVTPSSASIQTYRDLVIWCCQILGVNGVIDRNGRFVYRKTLYETNEGRIVPDRVITAGERSDIEFSDNRIFIKYLSSYSAGKAKEYVSTATTSQLNARAGRLRLLYNPLTESMTEAQCDSINNNILNYLTNTTAGIALYQQRIRATLFDDPDVWLGETISYTGGKIDIAKKIASMVTGITWRYRGLTTVTSAAPEAERG